MPTGHVKFFGGHTGSYGFLIRDDGGDDVFVHRSALDAAGLKTLDEGQRLQFDVVKDAKNGRAKAANLKILD
jgi:cold shock protein